jgi:Multidrug resistance efflux pump
MPDDAPLKSEPVPRPDPTQRPATAESPVAKGGEKPARTVPPETAASSKRKKSNLRRLVALAVLAVAVIGGATYWWLNRGLVSTDDAFIDGNAVTLSPQVGGKVLRLLIDDNQPVKAGDLLLEIDPRDYEAARDSAKAQLARAEAAEAEASANLDLTKASTAASIASAEAGLELATAALAQARAQLVSTTAEADRAAADVKRYRTLTKQDYASHQTLDQAEATARSSAAQELSDTQGVTVAQAKIGQAQAPSIWRARRRSRWRSRPPSCSRPRPMSRPPAPRSTPPRSTSPIPRSSRRRPAISPGARSMPAMWWRRTRSWPRWSMARLGDGEFQGDPADRHAPGQPVTIHVDAYPGVDFKGHVDSIMHGSGSHFSLLPPENATGNYVKVVQRVPVKILFDEDAATLQKDGHVLGLGMSAVPTVDMRPGASNAATTK